MAIDSIVDISEIIDIVSIRARELKQMTRNDFSVINIQKLDLIGVVFHDGKFSNSAIKNSDFNGSDLTNCTFKCSDLLV